MGQPQGCWHPGYPNKRQMGALRYCDCVWTGTEVEYLHSDAGWQKRASLYPWWAMTRYERTMLLKPWSLAPWGCPNVTPLWEMTTPNGSPSPGNRESLQPVAQCSEDCTKCSGDCALHSTNREQASREQVQ